MYRDEERISHAPDYAETVSYEAVVLIIEVVDHNKRINNLQVLQKINCKKPSRVQGIIPWGKFSDISPALISVPDQPEQNGKACKEISSHNG